MVGNSRLTNRDTFNEVADTEGLRVVEEQPEDSQSRFIGKRPRKLSELVDLRQLYRVGTSGRLSVSGTT